MKELLTSPVETLLELSKALSTAEYWLEDEPNRTVATFELGLPQTMWNTRVDEVERPFAPQYDTEEYKNPALLMLNLAELALLREAFGLAPGWKKINTQVMRSKRVLDVGCGTGRIALFAAANGAEVTALDQTAGYVDATASKANRLPAEIDDPTLLVSPAETFIGSRQQYDYITAMFAVINHCEDWQSVLTGLGGQLENDGKVILSMYGSPDAAVFKEIAEGLPYAPAILVRRTEGGLLLGEDADEVLPAKFPYPEDITDCLQKAGLTIEKTVPLLAVTSLYPTEPTAENIQVYLETIRELYGQDISDPLSLFSSQPNELLVASLRADYQVPRERINEAAYFGVMASRRKDKI